MEIQPTTSDTTSRFGLASATSEEMRALLHALEYELHAPLRARHACKSHKKNKNCQLAGYEGPRLEPAESKEELQELQAQYASAAPRHCTSKILR